MSEKVIEISISQKTYNPSEVEKIIGYTENVVTYNPSTDESLPTTYYRLVTQDNDFIIAENGDFIDWRDPFLGWLLLEDNSFILVETNTFLEL